MIQSNALSKSNPFQGSSQSSTNSPWNPSLPLFPRSNSNPPNFNQNHSGSDLFRAQPQHQPQFQHASNNFPLLPQGSTSSNETSKLHPSSISSPSTTTPSSSTADLSFFHSPNLTHSTTTSNLDSFNPLNEHFNPSNHQSPSSSSTTATAASLSDLSLAAYLETLDTLDLSYADGLTDNMISSQGNSMVLTEGLSYAVPSDFSWWDLNLVDSVTSGGNASRTDPTAQPTPLFGSNHDRVPSISSEGLGLGTFNSGGNERLWPRGMENGMGQGELTTAEGLVIKSHGWPQTQDHNSRSISEPKGEVKSKETGGSSCSSKKNAVTEMEATPSSSCCNSKRNEAETSVKSCCGSKSQHEIQDQLPIHQDQNFLAPFPPIKKERSSSPSRVHCVPNPTGTGCLCQHDGSVALLSVQRSLRETVQNQEVDSQTAFQKSKAQAKTLHLTLCTSQAVSASCACSADCQTCRKDPSIGTSASILVATSLQIYARAVHILREGFGRPSTSNGNGNGNGSGSGNGINLSSSVLGGLDVRIGDYRPGSTNARQIALFAMKLELRDLRSALGRVAEMARSRMRDEEESSASSSKKQDVVVGGKGKEVERSLEKSKAPSMEEKEEEDSSSKQQGLSPIDELVISKLYSQLGDLLKTIEALT